MWKKPIRTRYGLTTWLNCFDSNWFYQGKDGKYYGKADCMTELSKAIGRFSGSEQFLENNAGIRFSASYRWSVVLDFVSVEIYGGKLSSIYYSGVKKLSGFLTAVILSLSPNFRIFLR